MMLEFFVNEITDLLSVMSVLFVFFFYFFLFLQNLNAVSSLFSLSWTFFFMWKRNLALFTFDSGFHLFLL